MERQSIGKEIMDSYSEVARSNGVNELMKIKLAPNIKSPMALY